MDREKVIEGLEQIINDPFMKAKADYWVLVCSNALALLKEQDKIIQNILLEKTNELNNKVATLQIESQNQEMRRLLEQK